jgi:hypothetical protein
MRQSAQTNKPKLIHDQTRVLRDDRAALLRHLWDDFNHDGSAIHGR